MKFSDYILESQVLYESDKKTEELLMFADMLEKSLPKLKGKEKENAEKIVHGIYGAIDSGNVDKVYKELLTALKKQNKNKDIKESYYMYDLDEGIKDRLKSAGSKVADGIKKVGKAATHSKISSKYGNETFFNPLKTLASTFTAGIPVAGAVGGVTSLAAMGAIAALPVTAVALTAACDYYTDNEDKIKGKIKDLKSKLNISKKVKDFSKKAKEAIKKAPGKIKKAVNGGKASDSDIKHFVSILSKELSKYNGEDVEIVKQRTNDDGSKTVILSYETGARSGDADMEKMHTQDVKGIYKAVANANKDINVWCSKVWIHNGERFMAVSFN